MLKYCTPRLKDVSNNHFRYPILFNVVYFQVKVLFFSIFYCDIKASMARQQYASQGLSLSKIEVHSIQY